jgi:hypothetical protein
MGLTAGARDAEKDGLGREPLCLFRAAIVRVMQGGKEKMVDTKTCFSDFTVSSAVMNDCDEAI